ncbi:MAG: sigma-54-dependent Fis family transcriptional regulator, partial [Spirochaetales bacterium]|nr:sigma-54-dependent Fis family transcriptional regulator [Spirochaetales bacterium]
MNFNVLIVDDEKNIREGLGKALELDGYNVLLAENGNAALEVMSTSEVDLVISDLKMPELSGEELLKQISSSYPTIQVIILTGHGTIETAVNAMRNGAYDFLTKPVNLDRLSLLVKRALSTRDLVLQHRALKEEIERIKSRQKYSRIIGKSSQMKKV